MFEGRTGFLTGNLVLDLSILAWFLAQLIKTVANLVVNRNLDLKRMVGSGDMPSSHSSFICGLWESRRLFHRAVNICFPSAEQPSSTFP